MRAACSSRRSEPERPIATRSPDILASADDVDGLANTYRFDQDGELAASSAGAHVFEAEGVRWVTVGEREGDEALPVGTPGYLSVAACRKGRPHAYPVGDRLEGFSVELSTAIARRLGLTLSWRDLPCRRAIRAIADGRLDAALVPARDVPQGTLTSGIALATHIALVAVDRDAPEPGAGGDGPTLLERLGPHDLVTVVRTPEAVAWSGDVLASTGAQIRISDDRRGAYEALVAGTISAVADLEPDAWLAIERRPTLRVVQSIDAGMRGRVRRGWSRRAGRGRHRRGAGQVDPRRTLWLAVREVLPRNPHAAGDGHVVMPSGLHCSWRGAPI